MMYRVNHVKMNLTYWFLIHFSVHFSSTKIFFKSRCFMRAKKNIVNATQGKGKLSNS